MKLGNKFTIDAGFAPNSKHWPKLKPKWHYVFQFGVLNRLDQDAAVAQAGSDQEYMAYLWMAKDYCIYQNKPYLAWKWPQCKFGLETIYFGRIMELILSTKVVTCMNQCYEGDYIDNPYYIRQYGSDTPDFGPQDHSKKNNPLDKGLDYENFCMDPKPPVLDTPSPQLRQGAGIGLEPKISTDLLDVGGNMDITSGSNDLDPFATNSNFMIDGTIDSSGNLFENDEFASEGPLDFSGDSSNRGNMDEVTFLANTESADPLENLFLGPGDEGSDSLFASLDRRGSSIGYVNEGDLAVRKLPTLTAERGRKSRCPLPACL